MSRRSPTRFLAPLALIAAFGTIYLVVHAGLHTSSPGTGGSGSSTSSAASSTKTAKTSKRARARTYTVKTGDVLGVISRRTGVSVDHLLTYNRLDAAQSLSVGQKLKLTP